MAPPLEVPVNLNPIVKEPPLFADGPLRPFGDYADGFDTGLSYGGGTMTGSFYDPDNGELFAMNGESGGVVVLDGYNGSQKRSFTMSIGGIVTDLDMTADGNLIVYRPRDRTVLTFGSSGGTAVGSFGVGSVIDITAPFRHNVAAVDPDNGDMLIIGINSNTNQNHVWRFEGVTSVLKDDHTINNVDFPLDNSQVISATVLNGNLVLQGDNATGTIVMLDGYSNTILHQFDPGDPNNIFRPNADPGISIGRRAGQDVMIQCGINPAPDGINMAFLPTGDAGLSFKGTSDKTLATGKVYSFRIRGPNQTTTPTINDGGQGAKTVQLPGGVVVPLQSLTGNIDVYYDGDTYTVLTLTEGIAQAIYNYQDAVKDNMTATSDPTVNDDTDAGYSVRSRWYNTSTGEAFLAVDVTAGAAVWVKASLTLDELGSAATVESDQNLRTTDAVTHAQLSATQWTLQASYTVAGLPAAGTPARVAYASNGRKAGEGAGAGTGVLVFDDGANWIAVDTGATVTA